MLDIPKRLKEYKEKKAKVEVTKARIEAYQVLMCEPDLETYGYYARSRESGMPGGGGISSEVELICDQRELTKALIQEWIDDDRSRIALLEIEVTQIEMALKSLTSGEEYVIGCKYFDGMFWSQIELCFNVQFPQKQNVTQERLRQMNKEALSKLEEILAPFYRQMAKVS